MCVCVCVCVRVWVCAKMKDQRLVNSIRVNGIDMGVVIGY